MTNLFLDCEFNGFGGELISLALVGRSLAEKFYAVLPLPDVIDPWVAENVVPVLHAQSTSKEMAQARLESFLNEFPGGVNIVADWPDDIAYLCKMFIVGPGKRIWLPPMTFEMFPQPYVSEIPHNALYDAMALRKEYYSPLNTPNAHDTE